MTPDRGARLRGNVLLVLSTFAWATAFPATALLLESWHPLIVLVARISGGALVLGLLLLATGGLRRIGQVDWRKIIGFGLVGFAGGAGFIVVGQQFADPVTAAVIATSMPIVSAVMGLIEGNERLRPRLALGIALAVAGGIVVSVAPLSQGLGLEGGELLILCSQICWAWFSRRAVVAFRDLEPVARAALPMGAAGAILLLGTGLLAMTGAVDLYWDPSVTNLAMAAWIAAVGIGLSVLLWLIGAEILGVTVAALHVNLGPFYVMLIALAAGGMVFMGQVLGAALVAAGAIVAQLGPARGRPVQPRRSG